MTDVAARAGVALRSARQSLAPTLTQAPPSGTEKHRYLSRSLPCLAIAISICFAGATASEILFEVTSRMWPFAAFTFLGAVSFGLALPLSFVGRGFRLGPHLTLVQAWRPARYPTVDIYLPICGEPTEVLANTWNAVAQLVRTYPGHAVPYVLDDGASPEAAELAEQMGFTYLVRPDRGRYMKAGNLRHAFTRTTGEFFVILDADFAPRPDFLSETLPYFDDPDLAIVQTPQYFRASAGQTWVEQSAAAVQEIFYRAVQVARDRLGAVVCCGSCAVYRRTALNCVGGVTLTAAAEDIHTGLEVRRHGWKTRYLPIVLSAGRCPEGLSAFVRQQYRWCHGTLSTVLTRQVWTAGLTVRGRLSYVAGLAYYALTGLSVFVAPAVPILLLALRPGSITPLNSALIIISMLAALTVLPLWHLTTYDLRAVLPLQLAYSWAHALAIWDYLRGKTMAWQATGGKVATVRRFEWGVRLWSGGTTATWVALTAWRMSEMGITRLSVAAFPAAVNSVVVLRVIFPGKHAR